MKYLILLSLFAFVACDTPSQRRQIFQTPGSNSLGVPKTGDGLVGTTTTGSGGGSGTPTQTPTSGAGFESCNLTARGSSNALGSVGICRNSLDQTQIKFVTSSSDSTSRTCIIPAYKAADGSSTYLGDPQCTHTVAGRIYLGQLYLTRAGFQGYPMNAVVIMKEPILPSYFDCMHSYVFYTQNKNCTYEQDYQVCMQQYAYTYPNAHQMCCTRQATNYQAAVCNTFKSNFTGQYLDISL